MELTRCSHVTKGATGEVHGSRGQRTPAQGSPSAACCPPFKQLDQSKQSSSEVTWPPSQNQLSRQSKSTHLRSQILQAESRASYSLCGVAGVPSRTVAQTGKSKAFPGRRPYGCHANCRDVSVKSPWSRSTHRGHPESTIPLTGFCTTGKQASPHLQYNSSPAFLGHNTAQTPRAALVKWATT